MRTYQMCVAVMTAIALTFGTATADDTGIVTVALEEGTTPVSAQASLQDRINQLESRLAMIESQRYTPSRSSCPIPSRQIATNRLCNPERYAGFELAVLKPYTGSISGSIAPLGISGTLLPGWDFEAAPRVYFGCERCSGLGLRFTYFQFDQTTDNVGEFGITTGLEIHALDIEATARTEFLGSDLMFSGGIRYGNLESGVNVPPLGGQILNFQSEGVGPTLGARVRRQLGNTSWNMVLAGRASWLLTDASMSIPTIITVKADDSTMQVVEGRVGIERAWQVTDCAELVTQFAYEAQNWQSGSIIGLISPTFGLAGPTFRVGVNF